MSKTKLKKIEKSGKKQAFRSQNQEFVDILVILGCFGQQNPILLANSRREQTKRPSLISPAIICAVFTLIVRF
jgi:hypothetical protein